MTLPFSLHHESLGWLHFFARSAREARRPSAMGVSIRSPRSGVWSQGATDGSPKFPAIPLCLRPALRPRTDLHTRPYSVSVSSPIFCTSRTPTINISWLNHTASALTVYASCRPLGRRRKTRFRRLASLSGWAFPCPLSSYGEFRLSRGIPSPRAYLGASRIVRG